MMEPRFDWLWLGRRHFVRLDWRGHANVLTEAVIRFRAKFMPRMETTGLPKTWVNCLMQAERHQTGMKPRSKSEMLK
jgi:hypothetical protein